VQRVIKRADERACSQPEIKTCAAETIHSSLLLFAPVAQSLEKAESKNFTTLSLSVPLSFSDLANPAATAPKIN
jgi:hypothetical protein